LRGEESTFDTSRTISDRASPAIKGTRCGGFRIEVDGNGFGIDEGRGPANQIHLAGFI
jgi:hypothetical protein